MTTGGPQFAYGLGAVLAVMAGLAFSGPAWATDDHCEDVAPASAFAGTSLQAEALHRLGSDLAQLRPAGAPLGLVLARDDVGKDDARLIRQPGHTWTATATPAWSQKPRDGGVYFRGQKVRYLKRF